MLVTAHARGRGDIALLIGAHNVRRYFPQEIPAVELQLGELFIDCVLPPEFWQNQPEIHDPRLREWLQCRVFHEHPGCQPHPLNLIPVGKNAFRLQAVRQSPDGNPQHDALNNRTPRRARKERTKQADTPSSAPSAGTQQAQMRKAASNL